MDQVAHNAMALTDFRVQVGHVCVNVQGQSRDEAVLQAKRKLCQQMPRLWDVIHTLDDNRFQVSDG